MSDIDFDNRDGIVIGVTVHIYIYSNKMYNNAEFMNSNFLMYRYYTFIHEKT